MAEDKSDDDLARLRERIDALDDEILELLEWRAEINAEVGRLKAGEGAVPFVPSRELAIFERLEKRARGSFPRSAIRSVFREIISASISVQRGVKVYRYTDGFLHQKVTLLDDVQHALGTIPNRGIGNDQQQRVEQ